MKNLLFSVALGLFLLFVSNGPASAQATDNLAPVAALAGGTWTAEGKWPDGSLMKTEQRFFWGPTKRVLHFETYDLVTGTKKLLYEGLIFFEPKRGKLVQWNFKPNGEVTEQEVTKSDATGYEIRGANTWSIIRMTGKDQFVWELQVNQAGVWKKFLEAVYKRTP